jgi:nicotinamide-nucleotide amidase
VCWGALLHSCTGWRRYTLTVSDPQLFELSRRVGEYLLGAQRHLVTAESCTGGWIAKALTDVAGSSAWFDCGFVTYSNDAKVRDLGVTRESLERFGAVSEPVVREMAAGALRVTGADVSIAVSGIAGPDGGTPEKPVGTVWFCTGVRRGEALDLVARLEIFDGDREAIRRSAVAYALKLILQLDLR